MGNFVKILVQNFIKAAGFSCIGIPFLSGEMFRPRYVCVKGHEGKVDVMKRQVEVVKMFFHIIIVHCLILKIEK